MNQNNSKPQKGLQQAVLDYLEETAFSDSFYQEVYEPLQESVAEIVNAMREYHVPEDYVNRAALLANAGQNTVLSLLDFIK